MDTKILDKLQQHKTLLIESICRKAEACCPGSLALLGIYGSFATGDLHEHSDLDLLILINDEAGCILADTFLLDGIGYDLYCTTWAQLEQEAAHPHPHIARWMDAKLAYCPDETALQRLQMLREQAGALLNRPYGAQTVADAKAAFAPAYQAFSLLQCSEWLPEARYQAALLLYHAETAVCTLNRRYFRLGTRRVFTELSEMPLLPQELLPQMQQLIEARSLRQLQQCAARLVANLSCYLAQQETQFAQTQAPTADALRGTYEEMISNWRGKLILASQTEDVSLALHALAACQQMLEELSRAYALPAPNLLDGFDPRDAGGALSCFDRALAEYRHCYDTVHLPVEQYTCEHEWQETYLMPASASLH